MTKDVPQHEHPLKHAMHERPQEQIQHDSPHDSGPRTHALDLNHASEDQLAGIDMISHKLAHAIVEGREMRGGFDSWEDLEEIEGLDAKRIAELQRAARLGGH